MDSNRQTIENIANAGDQADANPDYGHVEDNGELVNRFGISSIPTLMLFKKGKVVDQLIGAAPKEQIRRMVQKYLS